MRVLVVNAGSSSLKLSLLAGDARDEVIAARELADRVPAAPTGLRRPGRNRVAPRAQVDRRELDAALHALGGADAVGHRIVHGGARYRQAVLLDAQVRRELQALVELAPLHQPRSLAALDAVAQALPQLPAVACFDTAFHATLPAAAATYALPAQWRERWGLRRYGFHGLSHAWVARRAGELLRGERRSLRIVSCHLGAGASLCAIADGRSQDTTMGFTPLEGLVMATRSGSVDPGMLLWLLEDDRVSTVELADALEHRSGLLALAGSADMREITRRAGAGEQTATLALELYTYRLRAGIAAMAAAIGGVDAVAFTGGIGQRSPELRADAAAGLDFLGLAIDPELNANGRADREVTAAGARARTLVIEAREDLEIARQARAVIRAAV